MARAKKKANPKKGKKPEGASTVGHSFKLDRYAEWLTMTLEEKKAQYNTEKKIVVVKGTDMEFAKIIGVRNDRLSRWKHSEELWERRDWYMKRLRSNTAAVLRGLIRNCISKGQAQDVKAYLEIVEGHRFDGRARHPGVGALESMADALVSGAAESGSVNANEDGSVDLTLRLKKYEFDEEGKKKE